MVDNAVPALLLRLLLCSGLDPASVALVGFDKIKVVFNVPTASSGKAGTPRLATMKVIA